MNKLTSIFLVGVLSSALTLSISDSEIVNSNADMPADVGTIPDYVVSWSLDDPQNNSPIVYVSTTRTRNKAIVIILDSPYDRTDVAYAGYRLGTIEYDDSIYNWYVYNSTSQRSRLKIYTTTHYTTRKDCSNCNIVSQEIFLEESLQPNQEISIVLMPKYTDNYPMYSPNRNVSVFEHDMNLLSADRPLLTDFYDNNLDGDVNVLDLLHLKQYLLKR